jgi:hypothetical protein
MAYFTDTVKSVGGKFAGLLAVGYESRYWHTNVRRRGFRLYWRVDLKFVCCADGMISKSWTRDGGQEHAIFQEDRVDIGSR